MPDVIFDRKRNEKWPNFDYRGSRKEPRDPWTNLRNRLRLLLGQWMAVRPFRLLVQDLVVLPSVVAAAVALQFVLLSCCSMLLLYSVMMLKLNLSLLMDYYLLMLVSVVQMSASGALRTMVLLEVLCYLVRVMRTQTPIRSMISTTQNGVPVVLNKEFKGWYKLRFGAGSWALVV